VISEGSCDTEDALITGKNTAYHILHRKEYYQSVIIFHKDVATAWISLATACCV